MATKNLNQMSSKKLNEMFNSEETTQEVKDQITAILEARQQKAAEVASAAEESKLTPEEEAAIKAAEENGGINPSYTGKGGSKGEAKKKMTDQERTELAAKLRETAVGHKCQVVPFNTAIWEPGVVVSIIEEKRSNKVMYAIKLDDGRRIVKAVDSQLIKVEDETVELPKKVRGQGTKRSTENSQPKEPWAEEDINKAIEENSVHVGKVISYEKTGALGEKVENAETETGRVVSLVADKRGKRILFRIAIDQTEDEKTLGLPVKYSHKVADNESLKLAESLDEVGAELNAKYLKRLHDRQNKEEMTPEKSIELAEKRISQIDAQLEKLNAKKAKLTEELEAAKKELAEKLDKELEIAANTDDTKSSAE